MRRVIALAFLVLTGMLGITACGPGHYHSSARVAASAGAFAHTPQFKHDEALAQARLAACVKTSHTPTALVHCVAPKGTFPAVARCVLSGSVTLHPFKAAEAALPRCVAAQEVKVK